MEKAKLIIWRTQLLNRSRREDRQHLPAISTILPFLPLMMIQPINPQQEESQFTPSKQNWALKWAHPQHNLLVSNSNFCAIKTGLSQIRFLTTMLHHRWLVSNTKVALSWAVQLLTADLRFLSIEKMNLKEPVLAWSPQESWLTTNQNSKDASPMTTPIWTTSPKHRFQTIWWPGH